MNTSFDHKDTPKNQRHSQHESQSAKTHPSRTIVHAKLEMTEPGDHDEQEADAIADAVVSGGKISRKISSGASGNSGIAVSHQMESQLSQLQGGGRPMPQGLLNMMENGFGQDFSQVRIHTDSDAASMSSSINAKAFTLGNDIYFNRGQFAPETTEGQRLVAHELTHVVQGTGKVGRSPDDKETSNMKFDPEDFCNYFKDANKYELLEAALVRLPSAGRKALVHYMKNNNLLGEPPSIYHQSHYFMYKFDDILEYLVENDATQYGKPITPCTVSNIIYWYDLGYRIAISKYIDTMGRNNVINEMVDFVKHEAPWLQATHVSHITMMLKNNIEYRYETEEFISRDGRIFTASIIPDMNKRLFLENLSMITQGGVGTILTGGGYMLVQSIRGEEIDPVRLNAWLSLGNRIDDYLSHRSDVIEMRINNSGIGAPMDTGYSALSKGNQTAIYGTNNPKSSNSTTNRSKTTSLNNAQLQKVGVYKYDYFNNLTITDR